MTTLCSILGSFTATLAGTLPHCH